MEPDPVATADQDALLALARHLRDRLGETAALAGALSPAELAQLVEAAAGVVRLTHCALTFDHDIELDLARLAHGD